jgi:dTDP-4-amino-4,6-dideoxygalactose transaminase
VECPVADALHAGALSLPCSVDLDEEQQTRVIQAVLEARR